MQVDIADLIDSIPVPSMLVDDQWQLVDVNKAFGALAEKAAFVQGCRIDSLLDRRAFRRVQELMDAADRVDTSLTLPATITLADDEKIHVEMAWKRLTISSRALWICSFLSVDHYHNKIHQLTQLAMKDELTGIDNRWSFNLAYERAFQQARRYQQPVSIISMDVNEFKTINDRFGHHAGDTLLISLTRIIQPLLRECDTFARIGGDEFVVLMPQTGPKQATEVKRRIERALNNASFVHLDERIRFGVSMGVASAAGDRLDKRRLLRESDATMYRAKRKGQQQRLADASTPMDA